MASEPIQNNSSSSDIEKSDYEATLAKRLRRSISGNGDDAASIEGQLFSMNDVDPALDAKMLLVNKTIDEIGWTNLQLKLFFLNGFGYCADSLILVLQSVTADQAAAEFQPSFPRALAYAAYAGMLVGALFWGMGADIIGRRFAFNVSLFLCAISAIVAGASPNWVFLAVFVSLAGFSAGGNLVLDTTVFLEYLPSDKQYLVTTLACWWGLAPVIAAAFAWPLLSNTKYSCDIELPDTCTKDNNMGWRYIWYGNGGLVLFMSLARITVMRLKETPKFLLTQGKDEEVVELFHSIAEKYNRPCSLTLEKLAVCGTVSSAHANGRGPLAEVWIHVRGLFVTRRLAISTVLIWFSWTLIGLAYPLFYVFLPDFLRSRGAETGQGSPYYVWRNYLITNSVSILGPVAAGFMCRTILGRRYTMVIGALLTMIFFFVYTTIRTSAQNLGITCAVYFTINVYYGCLYAYTPEVLPSAHRATGNGIAVACNRVMGIISAVIATVADTSTSVPIYLCASLYIVMAITAACMPFEPHGRNSM